MISCYSHLFNDNCAANIEFFPRRIPTRDIDTHKKKECYVEIEEQ